MVKYIIEIIGILYFYVHPNTSFFVDKKINFFGVVGSLLVVGFDSNSNCDLILIINTF